ncbi:hypothetical protein [Calothrix sp. UHCC 0171]|uniref:hypothetical protein n=1 Tax=Calothrix sp. UHCC 0171 TaxID=3110245 RepID=UPI002B1F5F2E|nr:hypothetical protein [Calothrix sp. UHCC 0171]MEA5571854.1 hypothetical protein [Calothrix sp. UHCC 0171]
MDLEAQIQLLIDKAPQDGITPQLITAIAPVLSAIASSLRHSQYYILQDMDERWVMTTLSNRANPELEKCVIYAYPTLQDGKASIDAVSNPQVIVAPIPVTHVLFQLVALEPVDSIVFFETTGTTNNTVEIERSDLQALFQRSLQQNYGRSSIPPDIA